MKYALTLILAITLAACTVTEQPVVDEQPPVTVTPTPTPLPGPEIAWAPIGECPVEVTLWPEVGSELDFKFDARLHVTLGAPCEEGQFVPFAFREQNKVPGQWDEYWMIVQGALYEGQGVYIAVPYENRANRYEVVDTRTGEVIVALQNYRLRVPRPF